MARGDDGIARVVHRVRRHGVDAPLGHDETLRGEARRARGHVGEAAGPVGQRRDVERRRDRPGGRAARQRQVVPGAVRPGEGAQLTRGAERRRHEAEPRHAAARDAERVEVDVARRRAAAREQLPEVIDRPLAVEQHRAGAPEQVGVHVRRRGDPLGRAREADDVPAGAAHELDCIEGAEVRLGVACDQQAVRVARVEDAAPEVPGSGDARHDAEVEHAVERRIRRGEGGLGASRRGRGVGAARRRGIDAGVEERARAAAIARLAPARPCSARTRGAPVAACGAAGSGRACGGAARRDREREQRREAAEPATRPHRDARQLHCTPTVYCGWFEGDSRSM